MLHLVKEVDQVHVMQLKTILVLSLLLKLYFEPLVVMNVQVLQIDQVILLLVLQEPHLLLFYVY